ncbi:STAS domain-containing protein [Planomicrobium sp. Y74]|uniref:STAS domain-containing protein n=1 Tax=Planomicrobium sp. Y74 TaxID=2478977 RepID=UPI000EF4E20D|nr:STAS domain-containing protein [Planomicrobium sp. Y74]RLQ86598.1 STAS domain-containing protein [Planomicrobium sp. Y74]
MTSISPFDSWPLPAYQLNSELEIVESSGTAKSMFGEKPLFLDLLDEGSVSKAANFLRASNFSGPFELNFKNTAGELQVCDLHCKWDSDFTLNVIVVPKDNQVSKISAQLSSLRNRLNDTNYDLLLEKERTEKLLQRVRELSAPTIELGDGHLLIPFFGDLDSAKIESIKSHILNDVYTKNAETVILDLTAMDKISQEGMGYLNSLLQTFKVMGIDTIITGVHPEHAKQLHALDTTIHMRFEASLAAVLSERRLVI